MRLEVRPQTLSLLCELEADMDPITVILSRIRSNRLSLVPGFDPQTTQARSHSTCRGERSDHGEGGERDLRAMFRR